jgi:L-2-hydroxyglutarate oxidase LhgO
MDCREVCAFFMMKNSNKEQSKYLEYLKKTTDAYLPPTSRLSFMPIERAQILEPRIKAHSILSSPSTGVISLHDFGNSLVAQINGHVVTNCKVTNVKRNSVWKVSTSDGGEIDADIVINAAGFGAPQIASMMTGDVYKELIPCRGRYLHMEINVSQTSRRANYEAVKEYVPGIEEGDLKEDFVGIRPKIGRGFHDFGIEGCDMGVSLIGMESPGVTSSLAVAEYVVEEGF